MRNHRMDKVFHAYSSAREASPENNFFIIPSHNNWAWPGPSVSLPFIPPDYTCVHSEDVSWESGERRGRRTKTSLRAP
jgi:hypothetical protein